jgi:porphobilinogen synthase
MSFQHQRMRRLRQNPILRDMVADQVLRPEDFVLPVFVRSGEDIRHPILSMPGQFQYSPDVLLEELSEWAAMGLRGILLFGVVDAADKDAVGSHAHDPDNAVCTTLRMVKRAGLKLVLMTDLCYCEYTDHGHCGPLIKPSRGRRKGVRGAKETADDDFGGVDNDATIERLAQQAVVHCQAGADVVAPSGMMDHAVGSIRAGLDAAGFTDRVIMGYSVKYASAYYGPFRDAAQSPPQFGDRRGYQMDFRRSAAEAVHEAQLDVDEGADMVMVKPGMPYLDVLRQVSASVSVPCAVYQVSGEYAMFKAAAQAGWLDEKPAVLEAMHAFKRAGASLIISYYAIDLLNWINRSSTQGYIK